MPSRRFNPYTHLGPARPYRPPPADVVPFALAPSGHTLDLDPDATATCGCGQPLEPVDVIYWTPTSRPADYVLVGAWVRHLLADHIIDLAEARQLRVDLTYHATRHHRSTP